MFLHSTHDSQAVLPESPVDISLAILDLFQAILPSTFVEPLGLGYLPVDEVIGVNLDLRTDFCAIFQVRSGCPLFFAWGRDLTDNLRPIELDGEQLIVHMMALEGYEVEGSIYGTSLYPLNNYV